MAAPEPQVNRWAVTISVMLVTIMQILDTTVMNVALPHMRGALSAGVDEITWVISLYLAANAVVIPATGWLTGLLGRRRFFFLMTAMFVTTSLMAGLAPNLDLLILARVLQGLGAGPIIPFSQAVVWEIFPLRERGTATAVWGLGVMVAPILGPTLGGWIVDEWSWRWVFFINLPVGILALVMGGLFLHDSAHQRRPARADWPGLVLIVLGFGALQLVLDRGEREDWLESDLIVALSVLGLVALAGFLVRQLTAEEPVLDLSVFRDRNFAVGTVLLTAVGLGLNSSMLLVALFSQQVLGYDAWTAGTVLAPAGLGNMVSLILAGRLVVRVDQRVMLAIGFLCVAGGAYAMSELTLTTDYWTLVWPRLLQGFGTGFLFVPLATLALATIPRDRLPNATACFNVIRNMGGGAGIALAATVLARRAQVHQATLGANLTAWDPETTARLGELSARLTAQGADPASAARGAVGLLYQSLGEQARLLAFADAFWLLAVVAAATVPFVPLLRRVRVDRAPGAPTPAE